MRKAVAAAKADPTPWTAISDYEAACAVVVRLDALQSTLRDEELARLAKGDRIEPDEVASVVATEAAVQSLLNGDEIKHSKKRRTVKAIVTERAVVDRAIAKAQEKVELARRTMASKRFAESGDQLRDVGRKMVEAIFALDRVLRERDALVNKIGLPAGSLPLEAWPLAGRLSNTGSQAFMLAETGVANGWVSQAEFDREYEAARKGDLWR